MEERIYSELRQKAINIIKNRIDEKYTEEQINSLLENVNIQNIELELQNDELFRTNFELSQKEEQLLALKNQYQELFEYAPVGYVVLDNEFVILECNFTFSEMLQTTRNMIKNKHLSNFISADYQDEFFFFASSLNDIENIATLETAIRIPRKQDFFVILEARKIVSPNSETKFQIAIIDINETKKLRQERDLLNDRLHQTLSSAGTAWWEWDMVNNIVIHSDKKATMLGYTIEEFPNNVYEIMKFVHPDDYEPTMEAMRQHIYGNAELYDIEYRIKAKNGSYRWYHDRGKISERNVDGKPTKIIGTVVDVTEKKRNYELFIKAFHISPQLMIISKFSDTKFVEVNQTFIENSGYSRDEIIGKNSIEIGLFKNPSDRDKLLEMLKKDGNFREIETEFIKKNGEIFYGLISGDILTINEEPHLLTYINDITDEKIAKAKLDEAFRMLENSQYFLHTLIDSIPAPIFYKDNNGIYLGCNKAFSQMLGVNAEDIVGKSVFQLNQDKELAELYHKKDMELFESKSYQIYEAIVKMADGKIKDVVFYKAVFNNKDGNLGGLIGTILDISERKKAENELKKSEEKYRELNSAKDKFFSIISHDLRNPFNVILTYANNLYNDFEDMPKDMAYSLIKDVRDSSKSVLNLIENLLEWARSQSNTISFEQIECDLYEIVFDTIYSLKNSAKLKDIEIETQVLPDTSIFADYNMVKTVIRNLVSNALKFTNNGGKIKILASEFQENEEKFIKLSIIDNGVGIPKSRLEGLFKIDKSESTIGTNNEEGTGLGLILCKEFIEKNNGKIFAESELGNGSKFHVVFKAFVG